MADKKFSPMRYTASSEEAAVQGALQIVGAAREEAEVEIIEQSAKGVTVRIRPRTESAPAMATPTIAPIESSSTTPDESPIALSRDSDAAPIAEDVPELLAESDEAEMEAESDFESRKLESNEAETAPSGDDGDVARAELESEMDALDGGDEELDALAADFAEETPNFEAETGNEDPTIGAVTDVEAEGRVEAEAAPEIEQLDPEIVANVQQKAQQMLDKIGLDAQAQIEVAKEPNTAALVIEGEDVGILIGKHGATLQAFQYLLNLTLNAHLEGEAARQKGIRVAVDAGNYRARRQSSLEQIARGAASKVRRDGRVVRLEPMPAHERRLVHMFLQTEGEVVTQSEGREPMRRIVVAPAPAQTAAPSEAVPTESAPRPERASYNGGSRSGFGAFRRGDAQSERNRGLQNRR